MFCHDSANLFQRCWSRAWSAERAVATSTEMAAVGELVVLSPSASSYTPATLSLCVCVRAGEREREREREVVGRVSKESARKAKPVHWHRHRHTMATHHWTLGECCIIHSNMRPPLSKWTILEVRFPLISSIWPQSQFIISLPCSACRMFMGEVVR